MAWMKRTGLDTALWELIKGSLQHRELPSGWMLIADGAMAIPVGAFATCIKCF